MGSEDLFHKRKARANKLSRSQPKRASYDKVLIVCEGSKTEPLYFSELIAYYKLNTANIRVSHECGSAPRSVVTHAIELYQAERYSLSGPFDRVYCVIDKDTHETYQEALDTLKNQTPKGVFTAINSVPCFEYWLLLHFEYSTAPFHATGNKSIARTVFDRLLTFWPEYAKGAHGTFSERLSQLEFAKANAKRAMTAAQNNHTDNPSTRVHELVEYLQTINKS